jgi:hypothetical protein
MRRAPAAIALTVLVMACAPTNPAVPSTAAPSSLPAVTPASSASAPSSPAARDLTRGQIEPGTYTRTGFEPQVTFAVEDGWTAGSLATGFFDIQQQQGTPDVVAIQFGNVEGVVGADGGLVDEPDVQAAVEAIKANPRLETLGESESLLGGKAGMVIEIENTSGEHAPILQVAPGRLGIDSGRRLWIALFDTSSGLLAVMVGGSIDDWDHALEVAEPVLESIVIAD